MTAASELETIQKQDYLGDKKVSKRYKRSDLLAPIVFLTMFVVFMYGALLVALLDVSNWIIHAWQMTFFMNLGNFGVLLLALILPFLWALLVAICAFTTYKILRANGHYLLALKTATIIVFAMFHIFALPFILWPMIRRASPKLHKRHLQKLRQMVRDGKMQPRLDERRRKLEKKGYIFQ